MHSIIVNESVQSLDAVGRDSKRFKIPNDLESGNAELSTNSHSLITDRPIVEDDETIANDLPDVEEMEKLGEAIENGRDSGCQMQFDEQMQRFRGYKSPNKAPAPFSIEAHTSMYIPRGSIKLTPRSPDPSGENFQNFLCVDGDDEEFERWPSAFYYPDDNDVPALPKEEVDAAVQYNASRNCVIMMLLFVLCFAFVMGIMTIDLVHYNTPKLPTYTRSYRPNEPNFPGFANLPPGSQVLPSQQSLK